MHAVGDFLRDFPPFRDSPAALVDDVVAATEIEFFPKGALVLRAGHRPAEYAYVVRAGAVELLDGDRLVDMLDPGDIFGLPSLLTDLAPGLDARASEDLLVYRIPAHAILPLFAGRAGLRFLGAAMLERSTTLTGDSRQFHVQSPALSEIARQPARVEGHTPIRDVVRLMHDLDASSVAVRTDDGWGIVTDNDLRNRVLAPERDLSDPVAAVMTPGALFVREDLSAEDVVQVMLMHSIRHVLVVDLQGGLIGVLEEVDLLAAQPRAPLRLRRAIARAASVDEVARIATDLLPTMVALHESGARADRLLVTYSVLVESIVRRLLDIVLAARPDPPRPFAFVVTGSLARQEMVPSSDLDSLLVWEGSDDDQPLRIWMRSLATEILDGVAACGIECDLNGVRADDPRASRSLDAWRGAIRRWESDPAKDQADIYLAALADARALNGVETWAPLRETIAVALQRPRVRTVLGRVAAAHTIPTGFGRGRVFHPSGDQLSLDLKSHGVHPIVDIGRYLGLVSDATRPATLERLQHADNSRLITHEDAHDLRDAFLLLTTLRLDHQSALIRAGRRPDNDVALDEMSGHLRPIREALRVVARAQRNLDIGSIGRRW